ncbi:MAG: NAD-dependent epimerase/dehydratase family protein [Candidatus Thorarchaeota archaeon]|jgi:nucleoside-diphosphate-sugar epimerase
MTVLLTGASGSMGSEAFKELLKKKDQHNIVLLLLPLKREKKLFKKYVPNDNIPIGKKGVVEHEGIKVVWGDLAHYPDVLAAVEGVDFVLHPAAFIAPAADHNPTLAEQINVGGTEKIIKAIKAQPNGVERIKLVYISSVAIYGDRLAPVHRIRTGDPLMPSVYDFYATTKIRAERAVIESGIKHWASVRQTFIAIPDAMSLMDPIMFHQPISQRIEMVTNQDAGYGLAKCLEVPDAFWGRVYNMGGGPSCRFVFIDYIEDMMRTLEMGDYREIMERNWFCTRNFHCAWYEDSHVLNEYLGHWRQTLEDHYEQVRDAAPWYTKLGKIAPKWIVKNSMMKKMVSGRDGTMCWIDENNEGRIAAFWGSRQKWESIPDWDIDMPNPDAEGYLLDHGYDESIPVDKLTLDDMKTAAQFRGGNCLSSQFLGMSGKLTWKCAFDHEFEASPTLVLKAGHWCPKCLAPPWDYDRIAKKNLFLAQVYYTNHDKDESCYYDEKCYEDILQHNRQ